MTGNKDQHDALLKSSLFPGSELSEIKRLQLSLSCLPFLPCEASKAPEAEQSVSMTGCMKDSAVYVCDRSGTGEQPVDDRDFKRHVGESRGEQRESIRGLT